MTSFGDNLSFCNIATGTLDGFFSVESAGCLLDNRFGSVKIMNMVNSLSVGGSGFLRCNKDHCGDCHQNSHENRESFFACS